MRVEREYVRFGDDGVLASYAAIMLFITRSQVFLHLPHVVYDSYHAENHPYSLHPRCLRSDNWVFDTSWAFR